MNGTRPRHTASSSGAKGFNTGLRALFCVCLLLLSTAPSAEPTRTSLLETERTAIGVTAPPTPLLEPQSRFAAFGGLERRLYGALPLASSLWIREQVYPVLLLPTSSQPDLKPLELAQTRQWRLEGG